MEEILDHGMTNYEQLGWLLDNESMEVLTMGEPEDEMIDMLVWASGEHYLKEECEEMPDKGLIPSSSSSSKLDLKPLPSTLKYAFLKQDESFSVIIASDLSEQEEEKLLGV